MTTTDFVMPKLGLTMTEGTISRWGVTPGSRFETGDIIVVVETDKIAYDVEAPAPGILKEVLVSQGGVVSVGRSPPADCRLRRQFLLPWPTRRARLYPPPGWTSTSRPFSTSMTKSNPSCPISMQSSCITWSWLHRGCPIVLPNRPSSAWHR